jgi:hypothetical protein
MNFILNSNEKVQVFQQILDHIYSDPVYCLRSNVLPDSFRKLGNANRNSCDVVLHRFYLGHLFYQGANFYE